MLSKARPYENPDNYGHQARRLARRRATIVTEGVLYANQWDNLANREGHMASTGPEIWAQTGGHDDAFICPVGTGGTLARVAE